MEGEKVLGIPLGSGTTARMCTVDSADFHVGEEVSLGQAVMKSSDSRANAHLVQKLAQTQLLPHPPSLFASHLLEHSGIQNAAIEMNFFQVSRYIYDEKRTVPTLEVRELRHADKNMGEVYVVGLHYIEELADNPDGRFCIIGIFDSVVMPYCI